MPVNTGREQPICKEEACETVTWVVKTEKGTGQLRQTWILVSCVSVYSFIKASCIWYYWSEILDSKLYLLTLCFIWTLVIIQFLPPQCLTWDNGEMLWCHRNWLNYPISLFPWVPFHLFLYLNHSSPYRIVFPNRPQLCSFWDMWSVLFSLYYTDWQYI